MTMEQREAERRAREHEIEKEANTFQASGRGGAGMLIFHGLALRHSANKSLTDSRILYRKHDSSTARLRYFGRGRPCRRRAE